MHFIKYKRKGYDIEVFPVAMIKSAENAKTYADKWIKKCCHRCDQKCRNSDHVQPYHLLNFIRLSKLYRRGGIFTDFTFFFLGPLEPPEIMQGYYLMTFCNKQEHMESWQVEQQGRKVKGTSREEMENGFGMWKVNKCFTSTLLVFNIPRSPIIRCMLDKYADEVFIECIESDKKYDGAYCISTAFNDCFTEYGVRNDLSVTAIEESNTEASPDTLNRRLFTSNSSQWLESPLNQYEQAESHHTLDIKYIKEASQLNAHINSSSSSSSSSAPSYFSRQLKAKRKPKKKLIPIYHPEIIESFNNVMILFIY